MLTWDLIEHLNSEISGLMSTNPNVCTAMLTAQYVLATTMVSVKHV